MSKMFDSLSNIQKKIVFEKQGKFVVRACPGSGKTYTVAARLAHKLSCWKSNYQGIATLSFTNVAWKEIERQLLKHFNTLHDIYYPHFLGTIDSFINNFIFLPFGHLVMGCDKRPHLVGEPHQAWTKAKHKYDYNQYFDNTSYDKEGNLYALDESRFGFKNWKQTKNGSISKHYVNLEQSKKRLINQGYANQSDANYFSMQILKKHPYIAKTLAHRFSMLIIDEAQDTSEIQMAIIEDLIKGGIKEIMLVGDPDQAIFEWHDAKPQLLIKKYDEWKQNSIVLNENRRSSQKICNATFKLSSLDKISDSIDKEVSDYNFIPKVITYDKKNINSTIEQFLQICRIHNISLSRDTVAILYRSNSFLNDNNLEIKDIPWEKNNSYTKDFAEGKYLYEHGYIHEGFKLIENATMKCFYNLNFFTKKDFDKIIEKNGFINYRKKILRLISALPNIDCCLQDWIDKVNNIFKTKNLKKKLSIKNTDKNVTFDKLFGYKIIEKEKMDYRIGTIHSAKGETFEATLIFLKKQGAKGKHYKTLLTQAVEVKDSEELRIVYVGMTRPKKLLIIAVPDDANKEAWEKKLFQ